MGHRHLCFLFIMLPCHRCVSLCVSVCGVLVCARALVKVTEAVGALAWLGAPTAAAAVSGGYSGHSSAAGSSVRARVALISLSHKKSLTLSTPDSRLMPFEIAWFSNEGYESLPACLLRVLP